MARSSVAEKSESVGGRPRRSWRARLLRMPGDVGRLLFRLGGSLIRRDGCALIRLHPLHLQGEQAVADARPRFVTPRQQAVIGWNLLPFALVALTIAGNLAVYGIGRRNVDLNEVTGVSGFVICMLAWFGLMASFVAIHRTLSEVAGQIHDG